VRTTLIRALAVVVAFAFVATGCSDDGTSSDTASDPKTTTATSALTGAITVSAAASLTEAFTTIKDDFQQANPDAVVTINFGSSGQLSTQIIDGAPADVAAFADEAPMTTLDDAGLLAAPPEIFARNRLIIVTKPGNPKQVTTLDDLATVGVVSLCAETAPCGRFANQVLAAAGVTIPPANVTRGQDVKTTLAAVTEGDAEAAIVYVTDAAAAGDKVATVEISEVVNVIAKYPVAVIEATRNETVAHAFEDYILGDEGQAVLKEAGFLAP